VSRGEALLAWYGAHRRDLPWRRTSDPYRILVSEVMLQQTQVGRVVTAYEAFLDRFPTAPSLADAPLDEILQVWQGLGYPVRARRLRAAARIVTERGWPTTAACLRELPGVGPYTAAAVASFAFGEQVAAIDTNVRRVVSRWQGAALDGRALEAAAASEVTGDAATWNQAIMELGALLCRPNPSCERCPVAADCADPSVYVAPPRQSRYEGSNRQLRGDLLRMLDAGPMEVDALIELSGDRGRAMRALTGLARDGLVSIEGDQVSIDA
jgi:A/G-specific adenine glycosylase